MVLPTRLSLTSGTRAIIDDHASSDGVFTICTPEFCMAQHEVAADFVQKMKVGRMLRIEVVNDQKQTVSWLLPLSDFARAHDGAPTSPQALAAQQAEQRSKLGLPAISRTPPQPGSGALAYSAWTKHCSKEPRGGTCRTSAEARSEAGQRIASVTLVEPLNGPGKTLQVTFPTRQILPPGTRVTVGGGPAHDAPFTLCTPDSCLAEFDVGDEFLRQLAATGDATLDMQSFNDKNQKQTFSFPLAKFAQAHDIPVDPKDRIAQPERDRIHVERNRRYPSRLRKAASPASDTATHFGSGAAPGT